MCVSIENILLIHVYKRGPLTYVQTYAIKECAIFLNASLALGRLQRHDTIARKAMISFLTVFLAAMALKESKAVAKCVGEKCPPPCQGNVNNISINFFELPAISFFSDLQAHY